MRRCYMVNPDHALSMITIGGMSSCLQLDRFNPDIVVLENTEMMTGNVIECVNGMEFIK